MNRASSVVACGVRCWLWGALILGPWLGHAAPPWRDFADQPDNWFRGAEGRRITTNILSWQSSQGSWPKNTDTTARPSTNDAQTVRGTFDNGATLGELRFLARAFRVTEDASCERAFLKGLDHVLGAQYTNGGWPQFFPPGTGYHRHITFNDDSMVRLMGFMREVSGASDFKFVDARRRQRAQAAFDRGVQCILQCQIKVDGKLTAWCAQHDEVTFEPRPARSYELVSLSGAESAGLLSLLMSLESPGDDVQRAVRAGAAWFDSAKLTGIRQTKVDGDKRIEKDPGAPPLWARFYEIGTNRPMFSGRDGEKKYDIAEIEPERRNGYGWHGDWGERVAREFARWREKWGKEN